MILTIEVHDWANGTIMTQAQQVVNNHTEMMEIIEEFVAGIDFRTIGKKPELRLVVTKDYVEEK